MIKKKMIVFGLKNDQKALKKRFAMLKEHKKSENAFK